MPATERKTRLSREEKKAQTRERLLGAAHRVFARRGYHGASLEEIALEAGYSTGAVYSNFAGKDDLFFALFEEHVERQVREYTEQFARGATLDEQARGGADSWMTYVDSEPDYFPLFIEFWASAMRDPELKRRFRTRFADLRVAIARMIEEGAGELGLDLPAEASRRLATIVVGLGNGLALEKLTDPRSVSNDLFGDALALMFQSLASSATATRIGPEEGRLR